MFKNRSKMTAQEEREQFDQFDRLQKTSGNKLDQDFQELSTYDKGGNSEELLATTDKKSTTIEERQITGEKIEQQTIENNFIINQDEKNIIPEIVNNKISTDSVNYAGDELQSAPAILPQNVVQSITPTSVDFDTSTNGIQLSAFELPEVEINPTTPEFKSNNLETSQIETVHQEEHHILVEPTSPAPEEPTFAVPAPPVTADPEPSPTPPPDPIVPTPDPIPPTAPPAPEPQSVLLPNGNYSVPDNANITMTFTPVSSESNYNNSFGHYFADSNGTPISGVVDFFDVKAAFNSITITYTPYNIPAGATQIGFFLIPDGAKNANLTDGSMVTFAQDGGGWASYLNGQKLLGVGSDSFFSDQTLNSDGLDHIKELIDNLTQLRIEDSIGGSDYKGNVVNFLVEAQTFYDIESLDWTQFVDSSNTYGTENNQSWLDNVDNTPNGNDTTFSGQDNSNTIVSGDNNNYTGDNYDQNNQGGNT